MDFLTDKGDILTRQGNQGKLKVVLASSQEPVSSCRQSREFAISGSNNSGANVYVV
jgi:hypothetical protein